MIAACFAAPAALSAQALSPSFSVGANFDTKGSNFYGAGMYLGLPSSSAWSPYVDLYTYYLNYPAGATRGSLHAFAPTVGLQYSTGRSSVNLGVGYAFVSKEPGPPSINTERGGESGMTASFGAHTKGLSERPYKAEFLSNYNFGSDYLWTRARAAVPFGNSVTHPAYVGLEITGQGANHNGVSQHSFSVGPTFEYKLSPKAGFMVSGGPKFSGNGNTNAYISFGLTFAP